MTFKKKLTPLIWNLEPQVTPNSEYSKHQHGVTGRQFPGQKPFPAVKSSGCRFVSLMITALCMWGEMLSQLPQPTCQSYCGWQEMALPLTCLPCPLSRLLKTCIRIFKRDSLQEQGRRNQDQAAQLLVLEFILPLVPVTGRELNTFICSRFSKAPYCLHPTANLQLRSSMLCAHLTSPGHFRCRWNLNRGKHQELNVCSSK